VDEELIKKCDKSTAVKFCPANNADIDNIVKLDREVFQTKDLVNEVVFKSWQKKNKRIFTVQFHKGEFSGYYALLPLKSGILKAFIDGDIREIDVRAEDIFDDVEMYNSEGLYLYSIVARKKGTKISSELVKQVSRTLDELIENGNLTKIFATAATPDGERLLKRLEFSQIRFREQRRDNHPLYEKKVDKRTDKVMKGTF